MQIPRGNFGFVAPRAAGDRPGPFDGLARGMEVAGRMVLEKEREAQEARDAAERVTAQAQIGLGRDSIGDTVKKIGQGLEDGSIDKTRARDEYKRLTEELVSQRIAGVPEKHQEIARIDWQSNIERNASLVDELVLKRDQHDVRAALGQTLEYAARMPDRAKAAEMVASTFESVGKHSGLPPEQLAKMQQNWKEQTQYTAGFNLIEGAGQDKAALQKAIKQLDQLPDMDPQKKAQLVDRANDRIYRIDERALRVKEVSLRQAEVSLKRAEATFNTALQLADKGVFAESEADKTIKALAGTPYASAFKQIIDQQRVTGSLTMQPPKVLQAEIDRLQADIRANGLTGEKQKRLEQMEKVMSGQESDIKKDPLKAYVSRYASEVPTKIDTANTQSLVASLQQRAQLAAQAKAWSGKDVAPLFAEEVESVRKLMDSLPARDKADLIGMISASVGPSQAKGLATQLDQKSRPLALAFAAAAGGTQQGRDLATRILEGEKALSDKQVLKDEKAVTGWTATISKELNGLFWSPNTAAQVADAAHFVAASKAAQRSGVASPSMIRQSIEEAMGGKIVEQGDGRIVLPSTVRERDFSDRLKNYPVADLQAAAPDGKVRAAGVEIPLDQFAKSLPGATMTTLAPGKYVVLVPRVRGAVPDMPVTNTKGEPIVIGVQR